MTDEPLTDEQHRRQDEGRCIRCGNWPAVCGHELSFKDRMKGINATYLGWSETKR